MSKPTKRELYKVLYKISEIHHITSLRSVRIATRDNDIWEYKHRNNLEAEKFVKNIIDLIMKKCKKKK